ncbi:NAD-dependent epimerase/dehydratase family protein [Streptomyces sp. NPDC050145]|uniref:NAD-dependent epimerase/dehydratase family protein n=1 Tax=Streptomyces sp. NPDC050145 TaxID=3365602 RepID=UPI0037AB8DB3
MHVLLLGGTWFLGRAVARHALANDCEVTTFNRGQSTPYLPGTLAVHGDRASADDFERLARYGPWDVVIDTSASDTAPRHVLAGARALAEVTDRYIYVSSVSVYRDWGAGPLTESSATYDTPADAGPEYYEGLDAAVQDGMRKAGCERAVTEAFGADRTTILRPGSILGPGEYIGRLPWWLRRCARGGEILAPREPDRPVQPIDARDVAAFAVSAPAGVFNVTAPRGHATMRDLLTACLDATGYQGRLVWTSEEVLARHGVRGRTELPLWPGTDGVVDVSAALEAGLTCRPLDRTVADTWAWLRDGADSVAGQQAGWERHGIAPDKEAAILAEVGLTG